MINNYRFGNLNGTAVFEFIINEGDVYNKRSQNL